MYKEYNPNPQGKNVGDCTVRALSKALDMTWECTYALLCAKGFELCDMPDSNVVWGELLIDKGFKRYILPESCPLCYTASDFAADHDIGTFVLGTGNHVIAVVDGCIYDSYDSSDKSPLIYFAKEN